MIIGISKKDTFKILHRTLRLQKSYTNGRLYHDVPHRSAILLFTDQPPSRTPWTNNPRARYTSLTFILQFVHFWLVDFRLLVPFADARARRYAQRKTQHAIGTEHDYAFDSSLPGLRAASVPLVHISAQTRTLSLFLRDRRFRPAQTTTKCPHTCVHGHGRF